MENNNKRARMSREEFIRKRKRKRILNRVLNYTVLMSVITFAGVLGIYFAMKMVEPYNSASAKYFSPDTFEKVEISKEKCNILIMGTDKDGTRTDVVMLAQIDPIKDKVVVMSIPRDTWISYNGRKMKLTEVHAIGYTSAGGKSQIEKSAKGSEAAINAIKDLTGVPINYHIKVNFKAFRQAVDELGGVDFYVPQNMNYKDPAQDLYINLKKGQQHLDGDKSEQLVRFRQYPNGDLDRIKVQQDFLHALVEQKLSAKYIGKIDDIYSIIVDNMETLMSPNNFIECGGQVLSMGTGNVITVTFPVKFVEGKSYVVPVESQVTEVIEEHFGYDENGNDA